MTERSVPWDGDATGDAGPFTSDEWRQVLRTLGSSGGSIGSVNVGVRGGYLNSLKPTTPGDDTVRCDTGGALADGTLYETDAAVTKAMATPSVGTTGKRLVLQKGWAAQTVRVAVISSADGTAALPALTQTDSTTWEIPLSSFTHATNGAIAAFTDEREFMNTAAIQIIIDGGGAAIGVGVAADIVIPRPLHLWGWELLADQSGAIKIDVWKDSYANFPPTDADTIAGSDEPEIVASGIKAQNLNIAPPGTWTVLDLAAQDILRFNVDSVTSITRATLILYAAG